MGVKGLVNWFDVLYDDLAKKLAKSPLKKKRKRRK